MRTSRQRPSVRSGSGKRIGSSALAAVAALDVGPADVDHVLWLTGNRAAGIIATELWDYDAGRTLAERQVRVARNAGALVQLQFALNFLATARVMRDTTLSDNARMGYIAATWLLPVIGAGVVLLTRPRHA